VASEPARKGSKKTVHWHACRRCRLTCYEDNCDTPPINALCTSCRGGRAWQLLVEGRKPRPCCREQARLVRKDEKATYRLAGDTLWFICPTCARTHPYDPKREPEGPP
jgi:hypothetical protein